MDDFYKTIIQPDARIRFGEKNLITSKNHVVPKKLYKYRVINGYTFDLLENSSIYHSHKDSFNDPFDGINSFKLNFNQEDIVEFVNASLSQQNQDKRDGLINFFIKNPAKFEEDIRNIAIRKIQNYGIACFTTKPNDLLMWSHYGDQHKGLCLELEFAEEIELMKNNKIDIENFNMFYIRKVSYTEKFPIIDIKDIVKDRFSPIYHKEKRWEYENEFRSIRPRVGSYIFDRTCLKSIYFGVRTDVKDIDKVKDIVNRHYQGVRFYKMVKKADNYELDWAEI